MDQFQDFQPLAAIATTPMAAKTLQRLCSPGSIPLWVPDTLRDLPGTRVYERPLKQHIADLWTTHHALIFGLATGAVVRLIAPLLQDKASDPAVVVVDETGTVVISLCGGHQGGADALARLVALQLDATPVLTGSSNARGLPAIDLLGRPFGWGQGSGDWTGVSAAIARGDTVQVVQEAGSTLWQAHLPAHHGFQWGWPEDGQGPLETPAARVWISPIQRRFSLESEPPKVQWHPRVLWVGIGCERNTPRVVIESAIQQVCEAFHLSEQAIAGLATLDLKADEPGLLELCRDRHWPLRCFTPAELDAIEVPTPSDLVRQEVGTGSVAEAAASLAASPAASKACLRVPKKIVRLDPHPGAVTVAIAQAEQELIGRTGRLWLVGTGPGSLDQITPAAQQAIAQADVVIGYELYVDLIRPLLHPGQIVEALPITQERQRAERAIELAIWGLTVAVISSGDCGIYGMAGLVLEQLQTEGWDGKTPQVQVFPGISALQASASRVGAPLMHDFCAISLSDLLTPWEIIEKRLAAAAQADFVIALYNPRSRTRTEQIAIAQRILLSHRPPTTPVAIVRSAYRPDEELSLTTLSEFLNFPVDMLTTVLIGNTSTRIHENWMITPRGYLGFS